MIGKAISNVRNLGLACRFRKDINGFIILPGICFEHSPCQEMTFLGMFGIPVLVDLGVIRRKKEIP